MSNKYPRPACPETCATCPSLCTIFGDVPHTQHGCCPSHTFANPVVAIVMVTADGTRRVALLDTENEVGEGDIIAAIDEIEGCQELAWAVEFPPPARPRDHGEGGE